jgi:Tol biopolymer transport system component
LLKQPGGWSDFEFRRAQPESGDYEVLARISGARVPDVPLDFHMILSPNGNWLATPLTDRGTTNLWLLPAHGGTMRQVTDFGQRPISIVRRVSWSPDSKCIYAAVAEVEADIVMLNGLMP